MTKKLFIVSLIILCFQGVRAQSLLHSKPLDYNPGFAGSKTYDRISLNVNELSYHSRDLYFSYDRLVKSLKGGIGLYGRRYMLKTGKAPHWASREERSVVGATYSPKRIIRNTVLLSPSIDMAAIRDLKEYTSQVDEVASLLLYRENPFYFRTKVGLLMNTKRYYAGYTFVNTFGDGRWFSSHDAQAGYIHPVSIKQNLLIDVRHVFGNPLTEYMRNYTSQVNVTLQHGVAFIGGGLNDFSTPSMMGGLKLINLKLSVAYHMLQPDQFSNMEFAVQYVFDRDNDEKLVLPFEKWWLKLKR